MQGPWIVVMGVSGCGKSSVGLALAQALQRPLIEGDDFHPPANVARMRAGQPLTDADRAHWLSSLAAQLQAHPQGAVLTCSALRKAYRDQLRVAVPKLHFLFLALSQEQAQARVALRAHFFPAQLVPSQFATLESPLGEPLVLSADAALPIAQLVQLQLQALEAP